MRKRNVSSTLWFAATIPPRPAIARAPPPLCGAALAQRKFKSSCRVVASSKASSKSSSRSASSLCTRGGPLGSTWVAAGCGRTSSRGATMGRVAHRGATWAWQHSSHWLWWCLWWRLVERSAIRGDQGQPLQARASRRPLAAGSSEKHTGTRCRAEEECFAAEAARRRACGTRWIFLRDGVATTASDTAPRSRRSTCSYCTAPWRLRGSGLSLARTLGFSGAEAGRRKARPPP